MILKNRVFERKAPSRDAKLFIIFCEGKKREPEYFYFFKELSSKINFEIIKAEQHSNNSPTGLYDEACKLIFSTNDNPTPKYEVDPGDEVWFVIDTDTWGEKISELKQKCCEQRNWKVAISNPCFEVWLYYHFNDRSPIFENMEKSKPWKQYVDSIIPGGFNSKKHPFLIKKAIENSKKNYSESEGNLKLACAQVYNLAENFYPYICHVIENGVDLPPPTVL